MRGHLSSFVHVCVRTYVLIRFYEVSFENDHTKLTPQIRYLVHKPFHREKINSFTLQITFNLILDEWNTHSIRQARTPGRAQEPKICYQLRWKLLLWILRALFFSSIHLTPQLSGIIVLPPFMDPSMIRFIVFDVLQPLLLINCKRKIQIGDIFRSISRFQPFLFAHIRTLNRCILWNHW